VEQFEEDKGPIDQAFAGAPLFTGFQELFCRNNQTGSVAPRRVARGLSADGRTLGAPVLEAVACLDFSAAELGATGGAETITMPPRTATALSTLSPPCKELF
jgi:hypothetical protein